MSDEKPSLKNIGREVFSKGFGARAIQRQRAAKSIWDLVLLPFAFAAMGLFTYLFFRLFWWLHLLWYPADISRQHALLGGSLTLAQFLMIIVPLFGSIPLGLITGNCLMWLIPPARRSSEGKAKGVKWASFRESQLALLHVAAVFVPATLIAGTIGAAIMGR